MVDSDSVFGAASKRRQSPPIIAAISHKAGSTENIIIAGRASCTEEPHKLIRPGAAPGPATNFYDHPPITEEWAKCLAEEAEKWRIPMLHG